MSNGKKDKIVCAFHGEIERRVSDLETASLLATKIANEMKIFQTKVMAIWTVIMFLLVLVLKYLRLL